MLASGTVQAATSALDGGIDALDFALKSEVRAHYDDLLAQLGGMDEADRVLEIVRGGVHALQDTMGRVREEIVEPHRTVSAKTRQLENITRTVDVLHRVVRSLKLSQRLKETMRGIASAGAATASAGDLAKAAKMLGDAREVDREGAGDLAGIDVVDRDARWLASAARDVRARTKAALDAGMSAKSQAEVGAALQVFHNLGELNAAVDAQISSLASEAVDAIPRRVGPSRAVPGDGRRRRRRSRRRIDGSTPRHAPGGSGTRVGGGSVDSSRRGDGRGARAGNVRVALAAGVGEEARSHHARALSRRDDARERGDVRHHRSSLGAAPYALRALRARVQQGRGRGVSARARRRGIREGRVVGRVPASLASLLEATHDGLAKESDASGRSAGVPPRCAATVLISRCFSGRATPSRTPTSRVRFSV